MKNYPVALIDKKCKTTKLQSHKPLTLKDNVEYFTK